MGSNQGCASGQGRRSRSNSRRQSAVRERGVLDRTHGISVARLARTIRTVEFSVSTIQPLVQTRRLGTGAGITRKRVGTFERIARLDHRSSPPTCCRRERGQSSQALGRSRGGFSTKIHVAVDGEGRPVKLHLTEGERHDVTCAEVLLEDLEPEFVIGDKGYDSDALRDTIRAIGAKPVIPSRRTHRKRRHDRQRYKLRNVVERFINRIKHCRRVATRYEKLAANFMGFVQLASALTLPVNVHTT